MRSLSLAEYELQFFGFDLRIGLFLESTAGFVCSPGVEAPIR
jgi:hypothetical protein